MGKLASLVVVVALLGLSACAGETGERPEKSPDSAGEESGRVKLSETRPNPGPVQSWRPPPVWLVFGKEFVQASYGSFCELDMCGDSPDSQEPGGALATAEVDAQEKALLVVGSKGFDEVSAGVVGWEHVPEGLVGSPLLTEEGVPHYMRALKLRERAEGERPVVELGDGDRTIVSELSSTGRKGDRLLSVFVKSHDGATSAAYHLRLSPGENGDNPPPEEKEFPGSIAEADPDGGTESHPQEEAARELAASVESFPFEATGTRIEAGEGHLWTLGAAGGEPGLGYPEEQYQPEVSVEDGVASSTLAARAADEGIGPPGGTALSKVEPGTREVLFSMSVPGSQGGVEVGAGAAWVATEGGVMRLDPETGEVVAEIPVGGSPTRMASGENGLWVALYDDVQSGRVVRIDPETNEVAAEIETPGIAESVTVDGETGDVWAVALDQTKGFTDYENSQLVRITSGTDEISERLKVEGGVSVAVAAGGQVWVTNIDGELSRIDPEGDRVTSIVELDPERGPYVMEIGAGSLWAASIDTIWRVDLESGRPLGSAKVGEGRAEDLAVDDEGNVWLTGMGTLTRVAPG